MSTRLHLRDGDRPNDVSPALPHIHPQAVVGQRRNLAPGGKRRSVGGRPNGEQGGYTESTQFPEHLTASRRLWRCPPLKSAAQPFSPHWPLMAVTLPAGYPPPPNISSSPGTPLPTRPLDIPGASGSTGSAPNCGKISMPSSPEIQLGGSPSWRSTLGDQP